MQLSIVSLAPHYWGNNGNLAGTYPGLCREIFSSKGMEIYYPGTSTFARTLTKGARVMGLGLLRDLLEKCLSQYPGLYLGHHKVQN